MKLRGLLVAGAVVALALPAIAPGAGNTRDGITGGGQAFFDMRDPAGAGDTIAFTAKRLRGASTDSTEAEGQIQVNRRGETNAVKFHGYFECLVVNGEPNSGAGYAYASGHAKDGEPFELYVEDGGKGQLERNDMIMLFYGEDETSENDGDGEDVCGFSDTDYDTVSMARGNVQVRNRSTDEDADPESNGSEASALSFLGL